MIRKIINTIAPIIRRTISPEDSFTLNNKEYKYYVHSSSWATERIVEVAVAKRYINENKNKKILELGNVLFQFIDITWDVVDKYEKGKDVINEDIIGYKPKEKYDLIVSVSTIEHIGFNEDVGAGEKPEDFTDNNKSIDAINSLKENCLNTNGTLIITVPLGYNKEMDKKILENNLGLSEVYFLKRISRLNIWKEISKEEIISPRYNYPFPCANYICVGIYRS